MLNEELKNIYSLVRQRNRTAVEKYVVGVRHGTKERRADERDLRGNSPHSGGLADKLRFK